MKRGVGALAPRRSMRASASAVLAYAALLRALRPHSPPCGRGPLSKSALPSPQTPGCQRAAALRAGLACGLSPTFFITLLGDRVLDLDPDDDVEVADRDDGVR